MKVLKGDNIPAEPGLYKVIKRLPEPSARFSLNSQQKYWYKFYGGELIKTKKLAKVDLIHVVKLAVAVSIYQAAVKEMNKKGYIGGVIQRFTNNVEQVSPHITAQKNALNQISEVSKHFGFSFLDRYNLDRSAPAVDPAQGDLFEGFTKQKTS